MNRKSQAWRSVTNQQWTKRFYKSDSVVFDATMQRNSIYRVLGKERVADLEQWEQMTSARSSRFSN